MIVRTVEQVRRGFRIVAGFTLLLAGAVRSSPPGQVAGHLSRAKPAGRGIYLGSRLMDRMKRQGERVREAVWPMAKDVPPPVPAEPAAESNDSK